MYLVEGQSSGGGSGGSFTPTQANIYDAVKDIFIPGANTSLSENDSANTIAVNSVGSFIAQGDVTAMDSLTQTQYDAITTKSATTLYLIEG